MNGSMGRKRVVQLPPPAQQIRPFGDSRIPVQGREEIAVIDWALSEASLG